MPFLTQCSEWHLFLCSVTMLHCYNVTMLQRYNVTLSCHPERSEGSRGHTRGCTRDFSGEPSTTRLRHYVPLNDNV